MQRTPRVLSIQSHVVRGYVGNKSVCFPLQVLGFEVDAINSVQLSNHTKYKYFKGQILNAEELEDVFDGLRKNNLLDYTHLLSGYCSSVTFLEKLCEVAQELKSINPDLIFVCDPVMGDNGALYVPNELLPVYRDKLVPLADIITPNQYEAEWMTGVSLDSEDAVFRALHIFHSKGCNTVVLSSVELPSKSLNEGDHSLACYASSLLPEYSENAVRMNIPYLAGHFTGTGDLFSASFLAWFHQYNLKVAVEKTINTLHGVLVETLQYAHNTCSAHGRKTPLPQDSELRLIQSKHIIENPPEALRAEEIPYPTWWTKSKP